MASTSVLPLASTPGLSLSSAKRVSKPVSLRSATLGDRLNSKYDKSAIISKHFSKFQTTEASLVKALAPAAFASLALSLSVLPAFAQDVVPGPDFSVLEKQEVKADNPFTQTFGKTSLTAPPVEAKKVELPEGSQWRYSEFLKAVKEGKVERVRFAKDGTSLQLTAIDGRRASVTLPNDPDLIDILAVNGVDISVSEGDSTNNYISLLGNLLFPLLAFGGLFFLFRSGGGPGAPGGMGGPMEFGKSKSKFQEVPETGVSFADVAGADGAKLELQEVVDFLKNPG